MIRGIHHVGITVRSLNESVNFFTALFDCEVESIEHFDCNPVIDRLTGYKDGRADVAFLRVPGSDVMIELCDYSRPDSEVVDMETYNIGNTHLCFEVDDLQATFDRLAAAGVQFRSDSPVSEDEGPYANVKWVYLRNHDEITIELCELATGTT